MSDRDDLELIRKAKEVAAYLQRCDQEGLRPTQLAMGQIATTIFRLAARLERLERERDTYRIEADCGLRDYDRLELDASIMSEALEKIANGRPNERFDPWAQDIARHAFDLWLESREGIAPPSSGERG